MELIAASHTKKRTQRFHKTRIKNIMAKQDLLLKDFLHGSNVDFIELQSDMRGIVIIILDLFTSILMYWKMSFRMSCKVYIEQIIT